MLESVQIKDQPIFVHRGLTLDTARNFIPVKDIERTLDGMAASKLNVFHWHATDSQSFPLHMPRVPQLTRYVLNKAVTVIFMGVYFLFLFIFYFGGGGRRHIF